MVSYFKGRERNFESLRTKYLRKYLAHKETNIQVNGEDYINMEVQNLYGKTYRIRNLSHVDGGRRGMLHG